MDIDADRLALFLDRIEKAGLNVDCVNVATHTGEMKGKLPFAGAVFQCRRPGLDVQCSQNPAVARLEIADYRAILRSVWPGALTYVQLIVCIGFL